MSQLILSAEDKQTLLQVARFSLVQAAGGKPAPEIDIRDYSRNLQNDGASFVTLTKAGDLRGCIGTLEAYQPLVQDVCEHARAAAIEDYRFPPVRDHEVPQIKIEISYLTKPQPLDYDNSDDLIAKLRPGIDGVVIRDGLRRATFLPQVWEKIPDPQEFMDHLCLKMGASARMWQMKKLNVSLYQVEEFSE
jgi:AmmeMemoRadiSam system protein A